MTDVIDVNANDFVSVTGRVTGEETGVRLVYTPFRAGSPGVLETALKQASFRPVAAASGALVCQAAALGNSFSCK